MKRKLALFDFCETLVNFQTADNFIHFVRKDKNSFSMNLKEFLRQCLLKTYSIKIIDSMNKTSFNKKIILWQIKGLGFDELNKYAFKYYSDTIRPAFIKRLLSKMQKLKKTGYEVYIISGGYDIYLKYFVKEFGLNGLICTKILFKNNKCCGKFDGKDCVGKNKIGLLNKYFSKKIQKYETISYSDSISDLPLLKWTHRGVVVSKKRSASWSKKHKLEELIWNP